MRHRANLSTGTSCLWASCPVQEVTAVSYGDSTTICFKHYHHLPPLKPDMIFVKNNYATTVLEARILRKKRVNRNISQFATKERKCFKMA